MDVKSLVLEQPIGPPPEPDSDAARQSGSVLAPPIGFLFADASYTYLLGLRYLLINIVALALLAAAYAHGWIDMVIASDPTSLCVGIFMVFLAGFGNCSVRLWKVSREINQARLAEPAADSRAAEYFGLVADRDSGSRTIAAAMLRAKLMDRLGFVRYVGSTLVMLGLLGTVVGFIMSLAGVKPDIANDVRAVAPMVSAMILGMSIALYTTLVGGILNIWLMANYRLLASGTVRLVATIVERGESQARF